jgi:hypothetical protein
MTQRAGFNSKVDVGSSALSAQQWSVDETAGPLRTSNTEGVPGNSAAAGAPGYGSAVADVKELTATVTNATWDEAENWFDAPRSINVGTYITMSIWPTARGGANKRWFFPNALVTSVRHTGSVPGAQPVSFTVQGDGVWFEPT